MTVEEIDIRHEDGTLTFVAIDENGDETAADIDVGALIADELQSDLNVGGNELRNARSVETTGLHSVSPGIRSGTRGFGYYNRELRSLALNQRRSTHQKPVFHWQLDDGYDSVYEHRGVWDENDVKPSIAVNPGSMGDPGRLTWDQTAELYELGWEVANHGQDHDSLAELDPAEMEAEVVDAILELNEHGIDHRHYVYSHGHTGGRLGKNIVSELYPVGWGVIDHYLADWTPFDAHRVSADGWKSVEAIKSSIDSAIEANTGMVLLGHVVVDGDTDEGGTLELSTGRIEEITQYVREQGGEWTDRLDDVLRHSEPPLESQTAVRAELTADQSSEAGQWIEQLPFDTVSKDNLEEWDTSNHDFVPEDTGDYLVDISAMFTTEDDDQLRLEWQGDGATDTLIDARASASGGVETVVSSSKRVRMTADERYSARVRTESSAGTLEGVPEATYVTITRVE
ncbi:polysaccharide deacetylase family protein [Halobacteria archaeon AArc-dxtr1]|nr:polysaccharide deacetylase family protein [Halobacteria archaeon AArc-dxtr1]